jgi:hypothetical protein
MLSLYCKDSNGKKKELKDLKAGPCKCKHIIHVYILPDMCVSMMVMSKE